MDIVLKKLQEISNSSDKAALCIIIDSSGSTPRKAGSKMIVYNDGRIVGTVGGGAIEKQVINDAIDQIKAKLPISKEYNLAQDLGMHCGGKMTVYIEPIINNFNLYIFGGGHIGRVLAKYSMDFGFKPTIIDERKEIVEQINLEGCSFVCEDYKIAIDKLEFNNTTFVVIVTHRHVNDEGILEIIAKKDCKYLGMIGSKNKVALARKRFTENNLLLQEQLDKVDMPIGMKINAQTPEEIAISIIAKLIDVKNSI